MLDSRVAGFRVKPGMTEEGYFQVRRYYGGEKGIALVTALLLTLIGLAIILAAIYFVMQGTKVSGFQKRYATALEASNGGVEIMTKEIIGKTIGGAGLSTLGTYGGMLLASVNDTCFTAKMTTATNSWSASAACNNVSLSFDPTVSPDITLTLNGAGGSANFSVYTKVVDTVIGNSETSGIALQGAGVVQSSSGIITPQHFPYIYRVEVQGQRQTNPDEKANLSAVYAY